MQKYLIVLRGRNKKIRHDYYIDSRLISTTVNVCSNPVECWVGTQTSRRRLNGVIRRHNYVIHSPVIRQAHPSPDLNA